MKSLRDKEDILKNLATSSDYSLTRGFSVIDRRGTGRLYPEEIFESLVGLLPDFNSEGLALFLSRNTEENNDNYTFEQFCINFSPLDARSNQVLHYKRSQDNLTPKTMGLLKSAWIAYFRFELDSKTASRLVREEGKGD